MNLRSQPSPSGWDRPADLEKPPATIPGVEETGVPAGLREEIEGHMANYPDRRSAALPALAAAQRVHGWCSPEAIEQVAAVMRLTPAYLESVASFYDMLETSPVGRHSVYVCTNISCSLRGADEIFEAFAAATDEDSDINVRSFECLGACDIAPMASVDGVYVGPLSDGDIPRLIEDIRAGRPVLPELQLARKLVADPHANSREYPLHPAEHEARAGWSSPDVDPAEASFGPSMGGDRPGPTAPQEPRPEHEESDDS
jgi:NADH:ubiquinone oxidoreductase subunit E